MEYATHRHSPDVSVTQTPQPAKQAIPPNPATVTVQNPSPTTFSSPISPPHHTRSHSQSQSVGSEPSDDDPSSERQSRRKERLKRPPIGSRKSSGTIIIPREHPVIAQDEEYDESDARAMSPRRTSDEIDKMGDEARQALEEQAHALQSNLLEIIERVDSVKSEHEKLEGGNKFLQSYIGELMQTSKITAAGAPKSKKRGTK